MSEESYLRALSRYDGDIRTGNLPFNYRTGQCGPVAATQLNSWGPGCPPGFCPPDKMPEALNRWFAGDRAGCRELPYTIVLAGVGDAALDVAVVREVVSKVTMCPTRMMLRIRVGTSTWLINEIQFGNQNQIIGGPFPSNAFGPVTFQTIPFVPDCLRAGQPFTLRATIRGGVAAAAELAVVFIGPAVG